MADFANGLPSDGSRRSTSMSRRAELRTMTEREIEAYLLTRDALRRVKRMSSFFSCSGQPRQPVDEATSAPAPRTS